MKHEIVSSLEKGINKFTRLVNLRVLLSPESALHSEELSFRADGLFTSHQVNFKSDKKFNDVITFVRANVKHSVYHEYRIYIAIKLAEQARRVKDSIFVECGVGEGILTLAMNKYIEGGLPDSYLIDTYESVDPKYATAEEKGGLSDEEFRKKKLRSYQDSSYESNQRRFKDFKNIHMIKGTVPDILHANEELFRDKKVSYLHIDMNNAHPEYCALKFFYEKMSSPGFVLLDDYGFKGMHLQKEAIDRACRELGIPEPISLPTGQGLIIKTI